jgi:hypothetical protein
MRILASSGSNHRRFTIAFKVLDQHDHDDCPSHCHNSDHSETCKQLRQPRIHCSVELEKAEQKPRWVMVALRLHFQVTVLELQLQRPGRAATGQGRGTLAGSPALASPLALSTQAEQLDSW